MIPDPIKTAWRDECEATQNRPRDEAIKLAFRNGFAAGMLATGVFLAIVWTVFDL